MGKFLFIEDFFIFVGVVVVLLFDGRLIFVIVVVGVVFVGLIVGVEFILFIIFIGWIRLFVFVVLVCCIVGLEIIVVCCVLLVILGLILVLLGWFCCLIGVEMVNCWEILFLMFGKICWVVGVEVVSCWIVVFWVVIGIFSVGFWDEEMGVVFWRMFIGVIGGIVVSWCVDVVVFGVVSDCMGIGCIGWSFGVFVFCWMGVYRLGEVFGKCVVLIVVLVIGVVGVVGGSCDVLRFGVLFSGLFIVVFLLDSLFIFLVSWRCCFVLGFW